jgi:hypothetical protein
MKLRVIKGIALGEVEYGQETGHVGDMEFSSYRLSCAGGAKVSSDRAL